MDQVHVIDSKRNLSQNRNHEYRYEKVSKVGQIERMKMRHIMFVVFGEILRSLKYVTFPL